MAISALGQVSRTVRDIEAATRFYRDVVGLPHLYSFGGMAFFALGETRLYLQQGAEAGAESVLYFQVDDIAEASQLLAARGVSFTRGPRMIHRHDDGTEEWLAFFADPEGRPLALMAQRSGPD